MSPEFENEIAVVLADAIDRLQTLVASLQEEVEGARADLDRTRAELNARIDRAVMMSTGGANDPR